MHIRKTYSLINGAVELVCARINTIVFPNLHAGNIITHPSHKVNHRTLILTNARKRIEAVCLWCVDVEETAEAQTRTLELTGHNGDNGIYQEV